MKKTRISILSLGAFLVLTACANSAPNSSNKNGGEPVGSSNNNPTTSETVTVNGITLLDPEDTSMLTENCKAYIDDIRDSIGANVDPYKYHEISLNIEDSSKGYLDTGDVNGQNRTVSGKIPDRSDKSMGVDLEFTVADGFEADEYKVLVSEKEDMSNAKELKTTGNKVNINNLFVNTDYYWKVVAGDEESNVAKFTTGDYPRWITCRSLTGEEDGRGIYNVRDLGG